jgi:hypothetical protein
MTICDMSASATQFNETTKGNKLYKRIAELEELEQKTLREWDNAENALRRFENKPKDPYYPENVGELNRLREEVFEKKAKHEQTELTRKQVQGIIENALAGWPRIRILPNLILNAKKQLPDLELKLKYFKRNSKFEQCQETYEKIQLLNESIEMWTSSWKTMTGDPIPKPPSKLLKSPPEKNIIFPRKRPKRSTIRISK